MKIPEHVAMSYLLAQFGARQEYGPVGTLLMLAAGMLPDLDGLSVLGGWRAHRKYHRVVGHGLPTILVGPPLLTGLGWWLLGDVRLWPLWLWLQVSLTAHLVVDFCFYRWPVELLWPLSRRGVGWGLVGWNDLIPTLLVYLGVAVAVVWPGPAPAAAASSLAALAAYLVWRSYYPRARSAWEAWLMGGWARRSSRVWRWLTGDFIT